MKNIKVTGLNGFIGKNLTQYLNKKKYNLSKIERKNIYENNFKINNCDTIIHLAGKAHATDNDLSYEEYYYSNFILTKLLFDKFLNSDANKFIYLSSIKVVEQHKDEIITEKTNLNPKTFYGKTKVEAETYILKKTHQNKSVYILRPTLVIGNKNKGNLSILSKYLSYGLPWPLGKYNNSRSLCSVNNLCFIIELLLCKNAQSGIYNICDDKPVMIKNLVHEISKTLGTNIIILNIPKFIIRSFAKIGDVFKLRFNSESFCKLTENLIVSNQKIKDELNIKKLTHNSLDIFIKNNDD